MSSEKNLLIAIIDTNPIWWHLQSNGLLNYNNNKDNDKSSNISSFNSSSEIADGGLNSRGLSSSNSSEKFSINDFLSVVTGFLNAYKTMSQQNAVALLAAHNTKADYLYPSRHKVFEKLASPWDKYEQINDMDDQIKENISKLSLDQLSCLSNESNNKDNLTNDSMITSAIGLALCYVNRIQRRFTFADQVNYRLLIIKASDDSSNQYMNFMNMIFSAEKLNVSIDSCSLIQDSSLLQQASNLTNGFYFRVAKLNGLLNYLLWLFLPEHETRKMLVYPPKTQVDFRAACFCHRKLIDCGYVCSVCLSVFCSFTPICSTCNCNFQFDVKMLKKASLLRQVSAKMTKNTSSNSNSSITKKDSDISANRLASKFQDTSLSSPLNPILLNENSNDINMTMLDSDSNSNMMTTRTSSSTTTIISAQSNNNLNRNNNNNNNKNSLNDSLEMLE